MLQAGYSQMCIYLAMHRPKHSLFVSRCESILLSSKIADQATCLLGFLSRTIQDTDVLCVNSLSPRYQKRGRIVADTIFPQHRRQLQGRNVIEQICVVKQSAELKQYAVV